jgi:hypothetical protein
MWQVADLSTRTWKRLEDCLLAATACSLLPIGEKIYKFGGKSNFLTP